jgi:hypothetical protein
MDAFQDHIEAAKWLRDANGIEEPVDTEAAVGRVTVTVGDDWATETYDPVSNEDYARAFVAACEALRAKLARRAGQRTDGAGKWRDVARERGSSGRMISSAGAP